MKVVFDTCLYIDLLRSSKRLPLFTDRLMLRYLSPLVLMELKAGAITLHQRRILQRLVEPYQRADRIIELNASHYEKAGVCLAKMIHQKIPLSKGMTHDVLIAISATSIGAILYTNNRKDFEHIARIIPLNVCFV